MHNHKNRACEQARFCFLKGGWKITKMFLIQKFNEKEIAKLQSLKQLVISRISGM